MFIVPTTPVILAGNALGHSGKLNVIEEEVELVGGEL